MPITKVTDKYGVTKGVVQNLQQSASTFAGMVTTFCSRLGWGNFELLLSQFQERLQFGVQRELCDLVRLSLVNGQRARILFNAGIQTVADLAACDPAQVEQIFHRAGPFTSNVHGENIGGTIYVLGKSEALSESEASKLIVEEARQFLQVRPSQSEKFLQNFNQKDGIS
jgi:DNA polymerase theta